MSRRAIVFPGQGSQILGMGKDFYENFKESKLVFEEASDTINVNLKTLCFEGPMDELTLTENLQPSLFTVEAAMVEALKAHCDPNAVVFAGHSLGEYSAHFAVGSIDLKNGVRLTKLRGKSMQAAVPHGRGAMAAILGLGNDLVYSLSNKVMSTEDCICEPANFNSSGQIVISGNAVGIQRASEILKIDPEFKGAKFIPLQVSAPFHCTLMKPAQEIMEKELASVKFCKPNFLGKPVQIIPNITAIPTSDESSFAALLTQQITGSVKWEQSMLCLKALDITEVIELGPGKVLAGLMRRIDKTIPCINIDTVEVLKKAL